MYQKRTLLTSNFLLYNMVLILCNNKISRIFYCQFSILSVGHGSKCHQLCQTQLYSENVWDYYDNNVWS